VPVAVCAQGAGVRLVSTVSAAFDNGSVAATRASGSNFYLAMRILPKPRREAMYEIYSFCRLVDDIADGEGPRAARLAALEQWRRDIDAMYAGTPPAQLSDLAKAVREFDLRKQDFFAVIDGMEMDTREDIRAPDFATLDLYCDRVASAVGRLSVRVFGMAEEAGLKLAHHLGRALQLTNILRDIDEDAGVGRLYLPQEALALAGIQSRDPRAVAAHPNLGIACNNVVQRAREHFEKAEAIMAAAPRRAVRAARIMGLAYHRILDGITARGFNPPRQRVRVNKIHLLGIALRYAII
jgi:presqualene diphosphate synthase